MGTWEKYAQDRHKADGQWVQTTLVEKVVGVQFRKPDAIAFAKAAKKAEEQSCIYGVRLELDQKTLLMRTPLWFGALPRAKNGWEA